MRDSDIVAGLVAQAEDLGGDLVMLRALVEEASEMGAGRALERLGLSDRAAEGDVRELRDLLSAWRDAKRSVRAAILGWLVRAGFAVMLIGMAVKLGLFELVRE